MPDRKNTLIELQDLFSASKYRQIIAYTDRMLANGIIAPFVYNFRGICFINLKEIDSAEKEFKQLLAMEPNNVIALNNLGTLNLERKKYDDAKSYLTKSISLSPNSFESINNLGLVFLKTGDLKAAIGNFHRALLINPKSHHTYNNLGNAYSELDKADLAIKAFTKCLELEPEFSEALNNLANCYRKIGKIKLALDYYSLSIAKNINNIEAGMNAYSILVQCNDDFDDHSINKFLRNQITKSKLNGQLKFYILKAIRSFLLGKKDETKTHLQTYKQYRDKLFENLHSKDQIFCDAYALLLSELVKDDFVCKNYSLPPIYHVGESHCLSFANRQILIGKVTYRILPKITFGAKTYHFGKADNFFTAITLSNLKSIPSNSKVLMSFGEIDCRTDEGILHVVAKKNIDIDAIVKETVDGFINWCTKINRKFEHDLYFFTVPANVYDSNKPVNENHRLFTTIAKFNEYLIKKVKDSGFKIIDTFSLTKTENSLSDGTYHVDGRHLAPLALKQIEQILNQSGSD